LTESQQRALNELWPRYGIHFRDELLDLDLVFGRTAGRVLEIGFGNGDTLVDAATEHPEQDFIGIEVHEPGIGHCLIRAREAGIDNLRIIDHDAIEVLQRQIPDGSISRINLLFPDPWPKKRHHKRRIVQPRFLELAARKLCAGGALFIATDWADYAGHIDEVLRADSHFTVADNREHAGDQALDRQTTKFEARGLRKGHRIRDWHCIKT
jgi:tRNA (guanine-N7-)-methyltransferase